MNLLCSKCVHKYYVRLLCSTIVYLYYVQNMSKLFLLGTKNKIKKICENENTLFYFIKTKIKICYIYRDKKLI